MYIYTKQTFPEIPFIMYHVTKYKPFNHNHHMCGYTCTHVTVATNKPHHLLWKEVAISAVTGRAYYKAIQRL